MGAARGLIRLTQCALTPFRRGFLPSGLRAGVEPTQSAVRAQAPPTRRRGRPQTYTRAGEGKGPGRLGEPLRANPQGGGMDLRRVRTIGAWILLAGCIAGWPVSAVWLARDEPQFVLGLSWMALILTSLDLLSTSQVAEKQDQEESQ